MKVAVYDGANGGRHELEYFESPFESLGDPKLLFQFDPGAPILRPLQAARLTLDDHRFVIVAD